MNKQQFLDELSDKLYGLPKTDVEERINFYSEMIDDCIEDGLTEEDAVAKIGSVDDIVKQIVDDTPILKIVKEKHKQKRKLSGGELALVIAGSPIWGSLLIAFVAVIFALYVSIFAVVVSLWSVFVSFIASAFAGLIVGIIYMFGNNLLSGLAMISATLVICGLAIFLYFACKYATKWVIKLPKKVIYFIKKLFIKREEA